MGPLPNSLIATQQYWWFGSAPAFPVLVVRWLVAWRYGFAVEVISGKARLAVEVVGEATGVDVLLIHAGVTDRRGWKYVVDRLRSRHRCVSYDARGYGQTVYEPEDNWSPVHDALAVLDAVGCDCVCIIAASMGGTVAVDLTLAHPDRVAGLALVGSGVSGAPQSEATTDPAAALSAQIEAAEKAGDVDEVNRLEAWLWLDGAEAPEGRVGGDPRELFLEMNGNALRAEDPGPQATPEPAWPRLAQINAPAIVMVGDLDLEELKNMGERLVPLSRLRVNSTLSELRRSLPQ